MSRPLKVLAVFVVFLSIRIANAQACQPNYVIVSVLDAHGVPITNLTTANFRAAYKGQPLKITSASFRQDRTVRIVVLLDKNRSKAGEGAERFNKWKIARSAASEFISATPTEARVSL